MRVSFILPVYNGATTLTACLEHLCSQTLGDWECIAVNDASSDNSVHILGSYAGRDSRIKIVHHDSNYGVAAARNTGIQHARGEYVHFLDQDDHLFPDGVQQLLHCAKQHPDAAGIHGDYCLVDTKNERLLARKEMASTIGFEDIASFHGLIPICALMPIASVRNVGGFQTGFEGCDDWDLFAKLTRSGKDFHRCPVLVGEWRFHGGNNSRKVGRMLVNGLKVVDRLFAPDERVPDVHPRWINGAPPALRPIVSIRLLFFQLAALISANDVDGAVELVVQFTRLARADYLTPESFEILHHVLQFEATLAGFHSRESFLRFEPAVSSILTRLEKLFSKPGWASDALAVLRTYYIEDLVSENCELASQVNRYQTSRSYRIGRAIVKCFDPVRLVLRFLRRDAGTRS